MGRADEKTKLKVRLKATFISDVPIFSFLGLEGPVNML
jgi:hypothetical protein